MTPEPTNHEALREQAALYALGVLTAAERSVFDEHLEGCADCAAEVRAFLPVSSALAQGVPQHDPPPALRGRILAAARRTSESPRRMSALAPWLAAAAMLVLTAGLGIYTTQLRQRVRALELQLREALVRVDNGERRVAVALRSAAAAEVPMAILTAPDVRQIDLAGQPVAPRAAARAFWSPSRGLVMTASNLPALPAGRTYQLWFVTAQAPVSAGLLTPDARGRLTTVLNTPADMPQPAALAVTLEPEGGSPGPTGEKYLIGLAN
jgi:anti-sigma-K factor RskA